MSAVAKHRRRPFRIAKHVQVEIRKLGRSIEPQIDGQLFDS
jgi:hypothetical protein